eukprot:g29181.t1
MSSNVTKSKSGKVTPLACMAFLDSNQSTSQFVEAWHPQQFMKHFFHDNNSYQGQRPPMPSTSSQDFQFPDPQHLILTMDIQSLTLFCCYTGTIPYLFLSYVNDCIGAVSCSHEELEQFINFTNTFHSNLKFTWTISNIVLPFLELSVSIS